jgi:hypothetical protein
VENHLNNVLLVLKVCFYTTLFVLLLALMDYIPIKQTILALNVTLLVLNVKTNL